ncbi:MAG: FAD-dependent oxidoreductase [Verrucomicrobia bacterium]|nr:FAD-dependent oxidoreductase [Verrucomicrobiota bacterium]
MSKSIVIIGGGVIGLSTAYYAAQRGHRVTLIERAGESRDGCSFGNAGMIVPSHFVPLAAPGMVALGLKWMWDPESPFWIKPRLDRELIAWCWKFFRSASRSHVERVAPLLRDLSFASRALFEELSAQSGDEFALVKRGLLMLCRSQHALDDEIKNAGMARRLGVPAEVLDAAETSSLDPNIQMNIAGSVYFPQDCHLSPARFMSFLRREAGKLGVEFHWDTEVTGWRTEGRRVVALQTSAGDFSADEFVLGGGVWSSSITRDLQLRLPMQAGKGYSLTLPHPRQLPEICAILTEARVAVTPMNGALRFGGTMEIAGLDESINSRRVQGIIKAAAQYYPEFQIGDFSGVQPWVGLRPCSPDGLPYLGRTARYANLCVVTGHAMMGLSLAPITGKLMAQVLSDETPAINLTLLSPDRF